MNLFLPGNFRSWLLLKYFKKRCLTAFFFLISEPDKGFKNVILKKVFSRNNNQQKSASENEN